MLSLPSFITRELISASQQKQACCARVFGLLLTHEFKASNDQRTPAAFFACGNAASAGVACGRFMDGFARFVSNLCDRSEELDSARRERSARNPVGRCGEERR